MTIAVSPHYEYPADGEWRLGGPAEQLLNALHMFERSGPLTGRSRGVGGGSADKSKEGPQFLYEQIRLFKSGKMSALVELVPVPDVSVSSLRPATRHAEDLFGENRTPGRHANSPGPADELLQTLPVKAAGGRPVAGSQYIITLSSSSSRDTALSRSPPQSVATRNFSTIQAHCPAGESTRL